MSEEKKDFVEENMVEEQETVEEEIVEETVEQETVEEEIVEETVEEEIVEETVEQEVEEEEILGEVFNCERLNVRTSPSTKAAVRGVIDEGDVVKILEDRDEWYKILTKNNVEGFCMAEYITKLP